MNAENIIPVDPKTDIEVDLKFSKKTEREIFLKKLREYQNQTTFDRKPFDFRCAKIDFEKEQEDQFREHGTRIAKQVDNVVIKDFDFKKYTDPKRFKLLKKTPIHEVKTIDGVKNRQQVGDWHDYLCTERGCRLSIEVPLDIKK